MRIRADAFLIVTLVAVCSLQAAVSDPYEIMNRSYAAQGGLEVLKAQKTQHSQGSIDLVGTGLKGTFEQWSEYPIRSREVADLGILKQTSGDNGEYAWTVDHNGKLQIHQDEKSLNERRLKTLEADYLQLDPHSDVFVFSYEGLDTAAGATCYVVKMANHLTPDTVYQYFDTSSFLQLKARTITLDGYQVTLISDYRPVSGILVPFRQETTMYPTGMVQVVEVTQIEMNVPVDPTLFEPPGAQAADFHFTNGGKAENIPFQFIDKHIYLPVQVGGITRIWVLDSGAGASCIEKRFADELGLKSEGSMKGRGAGALVDMEWMTLPPFSLPGIAFDKQAVAALDMYWLFKKWVGLEVAGILGYDFLSRFVVKVDYAHELLSFYLPDSFQYQGPGIVLKAPVAQDNMFHLPVTVDGKYAGDWNLDLGAGGMSFHYPYARAHGLLDLPGIERMGHGAGGSMIDKTARFKTIEFAGSTLKEPLIDISVDSTPGAFANAELTGNIGNTLLRNFVLYLDYKRGQVIVEKGADFGKQFPEDNSGLQVEHSEDNRLRVYFVSANTPGAKAGFKVGDVLVSINGIDTEHLGGIVAIKDMFMAGPGTQYQIVVDRNGEHKTLKLKLADLYAKL